MKKDAQRASKTKKQERSIAIEKEKKHGVKRAT
jgi:hypothetical protein